LREAAASEAAADDQRVRTDPLVQAAFTAFPEAELLGTEGNVARAARPPWN
jgi:DNA polymerase-3 subunit gamma/tau